MMGRTTDVALATQVSRFSFPLTTKPSESARRRPRKPALPGWEGPLDTRSAQEQKCWLRQAHRAGPPREELRSGSPWNSIAYLSNSAEQIRRREFEELMTSLSVSEDQKSKIESFGKSLVGQIIHQSIVKMREYVNLTKFK